MINQIVSLFIALVISVSTLVGVGLGANLVQPTPTSEGITLGAFSDPFISLQLATSPSNGDCLTTDGTNNAWSTCAAGSSSANSKWATSTGTTIIPNGSGGIIVSASSTISDITSTNGTTTNATTTNLFSTTASSTNLYSSLLTVGGTGLVVDSSRNVAIGYASPANKLDVSGSLSLASGGFLGFTGNTAIGTTNYSLFGNATLTLLNARSGGSIGFRIANTDVANFNTSGGFGFGSTYYNIDAGANNMIIEGNVGIGASAPTTKLEVQGGLLVNNASSTITNIFSTNSTSTNATSTNLSISGTLDVDNLTSALTLTGSTGIFAEYTGTSCTNQFVRSISALGVATCATVSSGDVSLANLTATDSTLTFSGTYNGATARTIGLNLASANVWTASTTFTGGLTAVTGTTTSATSTNLQVSSKLTIPNGTAPTVAVAGDIAIDTTSGQLKWYDGVKTQIVTGTTTKAFNIASTTLDAMGKSFNTATSTFLLMNNAEPLTLVGFYCTASTTGTALVRFGDGTNWTTEGSCTSGSFTTTSSNNTFTAFEAFNIQASSTAGAVSRITVTAVFNKTAD